MDLDLGEGEIIRVLLPASRIPDGAIVSKRAGEVTTTLKHDLKVYSDTKGEAPLVVTGLFLVNERAQVNQIKPETLLHWHVTCAEFVLALQNAWEPTPQ